MFRNRKGGESDKGESQLRAIVEYIHDYCEEEHISRLPNICLPPLEQQIMVAELDADEGSFQKGITVPLGYFDDPQQRRQGTYVLNVSDGNTYVMGCGADGKDYGAADHAVSDDKPLHTGRSQHLYSGTAGTCAEGVRRRRSRGRRCPLYGGGTGEETCSRCWRLEWRRERTYSPARE